MRNTSDKSIWGSERAPRRMLPRHPRNRHYFRHAITSGSGSRRSRHSMCVAGARRRGPPAITAAAAARRSRLRHRGKTAHQAGRRLAETAPMAATLLDAAGAPELEHLAIEPPHRRMRRIRERQSLIHRAPLGEVLFARLAPAASHGSLRHRHARSSPFACSLFSRSARALPLPACGERVGVRGRLRKAQTRGNAPSPGSSRFARAPTSPRAAGEVKKANPLSRRVRARVLPTPRARKHCVMISSGQAGGGTGVAMITRSKIRSVAG